MASTPMIVRAEIASRSVAGVPLSVFIGTFLIMVLDGFDVQLIGFAAPALIAEFGIERSALGPALAASVLGMSIGAVAIGPVGDAFGRRPALLLSAALFGAMTLLTATATSVDMLTLWRFLTGIGLGAALPGAVALMAEFTPARHRSQLVVMSLLGVPVGGILGSALAAEIIPAFGWPAIFVVGGALPILAAAVLFFVLPESPGFLARTPNAGEGGLRAVFARAHAGDAVVLMIAFFCSLFAAYAFFSWVPVVLTSLSFPLDQAVRSALVFNLAGVGGALLNAWLISRIGSLLPLAAVAGVAVVSLITLAGMTLGADAEPGALATFAIIAAAGFGIHSLQTGLYLVSAHVFPTECRTSGVGFASGAGRLGGIASSLTGGALLTGAGAAGFFGSVALALVLAVVCVLTLRRHIPVQVGRD
ncbi:MAG TPA: MFS transporter [Steroidobacteraceae bacterium]|nr:MFS transporter [Steroidobacteraceae bacterium]